MSKPFVVLGINYGGHDTSAALMCDGELVAACEQERYTGDKHSRRFPIEAIQDCYKQSGLLPEQLTKLAYGFDPIYHIKESYLLPAIKNDDQIVRIIDDIDRIRDNYFVENLIRKQTKFCGAIEYYNHHYCHLASTYYPSGFTNALLVSYDGIGEHETGMIGIGNSGNIQVIHKSSVYPDSLGLLYSAVTYFLGWKHHCDEGIIMGLATYGNAKSVMPGTSQTYKDVFDQIIESTGPYSYRINLEWISYHEKRDSWVSDKFYETFGQKRNYDTDITQHHMDIAAGLQLRLEEIVINQLEHASSDTKLKHLCLSGGVALNCSMNGKIERSGLFDEIFVQPAAGDSGVAIGACFLASKKTISRLKPKKQHNFYLGSGFNDDEVEAVLDSRRIPVHRLGDVYKTTAQHLSDGKIVAWFQGRAEFGPRALGNRSILTRPYPGNMKDYLNNRVKFREKFRPFAPAVLFEHMDKYFDIKQETPHMLIACQATPRAQETIQATVHVDNSCRVQSVKKDNNEKFYKLLSAFHEITGCPVLLNTSFNVKGQPIVNTPEQAIDCYLSTNIDCLVLGDYLLLKS
jgi:carbamoyltransferase